MLFRQVGESKTPSHKETSDRWCFYLRHIFEDDFNLEDVASSIISQLTFDEKPHPFLKQMLMLDLNIMMKKLSSVGMFHRSRNPQYKYAKHRNLNPLFSLCQTNQDDHFVEVPTDLFDFSTAKIGVVQKYTLDSLTI